jgi:nucleoside-diphosphate-sugar epimerase
MKVLITGIDGYIGTVLAQVLIEKGHEVTGIDTGFYREGWLYNGTAVLPKVINKDIRAVTTKELKGYDAVIHLADLSNDPLGFLNEKTTYSINHLAAIEFAKKAKAAGVKRYIYSSSCSVYGIATEDMVTEESSTNPQTTYAKCKLLVENGLKEMADNTFTPVILRNATVFGASPRLRLDLVVNSLTGFAFVHKEIRLSSDGKPWRPLVHILDVSEAFAAALTAPAETVHKQIFNVGKNNGNYRIIDVADIVKTEFPDCEITVGESNGDTRSYRVSFEKINTKLPGFSASRDVLYGVKELKNIFTRVQLTKDQFESRSYTRLKMIEYLSKTGQITSEYLWTEK